VAAVGLGIVPDLLPQPVVELLLEGVEGVPGVVPVIGLDIDPAAGVPRAT
jgi:hypothetical protein